MKDLLKNYNTYFEKLNFLSSYSLDNFQKDIEKSIKEGVLNEIIKKRKEKENLPFFSKLLAFFKK